MNRSPRLTLLPRSVVVETITITRSKDSKEFCGKCGAKRIDNQLELELTPDEYIANMVVIFAEVERVLRNDGSLWLNLGGCYAHSGACSGGSVFENPTDGLKPEIIPGPSHRQNSNRGN